VTRTARLATAAIVLALGLAACGEGQDPATLDEAPLDAARATADPLAVRGAIVVAPPDGDGNGMLVATIVNNGESEDALTQVTLTNMASDSKAILRPPRIALPARQATRIPDESQPLVTVTGTLTPGTYVTARLSFENAGSVDLTLLVVEPTGSYEDYVVDASA
jgi:copper(I)-binding protein